MNRAMARLRHAGSAVLLVVMLAACGSSASTSPPADSAAPGAGFTADQLCALVSQSAMAAALGNAVDAGVGSGVNAPSCTWQGNGDSSASATIAATAPDTVGQLPFGLQGLENAHTTAVPGLGDAAFFAAGNGTTSELDIRKGSHAVTITVGSTDPNYTQAQQQAAELAIGKAAVGGM